MKHLHKHLLLLCLLAYACSDNESKVSPYFKIIEDKEAYTLNQNSHRLALIIQANVGFSATSDATWLSFEEINGDLIVKVSENNSSIDREATFSLLPEGLDKITRKIWQSGADEFIYVNDSQRSFTITGADIDERTFTVPVSANVKYAISCPSWINIKGEEAISETEKSLTFVADELTNGASRSGFIEITSSGTSTALTISIEVTQGVLTPPMFIVMSDLHHGSSYGGMSSKDKVSRILTNLLAQAPGADAIFVAGDITHNGKTEEYSELINVFEQCVPATTKVYFLMGNHDHYLGTGGVSEEMFLNKLAENERFKLDEISYYIEINGYPFISISQRSKANNGTGRGIYPDEEKNNLKKYLEKAASKYPRKPIFVFMHTPASNTVYGSNSSEGTFWSSGDLSDILNQYPQVIAFSGHSHYPIGDPRSIDQTYFTAINDGNSAYLEVEEGFTDGIHPDGYEKSTESMVVTLDNRHNVTVKRYNTRQNIELAPAWEIYAPHDGSRFVYTKNRETNKVPVFDAGTQLTVNNIRENSVDVTFPQAKPADEYNIVHHYIIELTNKSTQVAVTQKYSSRFYLNHEMPAILKFTISGLEGGTTYTAKVTAVNSNYTNDVNKSYSAPLISTEFTTIKTTVIDPSDALPIDISFDANGNALNNGVALDYIKKQAVTSYNPTYKRYEGYFDKTSCYYVPYTETDAIGKAISGKFSAELLFSPDGGMNPFASMESGGTGFEINRSNELEYYHHLGGSWKRPTITTLSLGTGTYYHVIVTYDGLTMKAYLNGVQSGSWNYSGAFKFANHNNAPKLLFCLGSDYKDEASPASAQNAFQGKIVWAKLYPYVVTADKVSEIYQGLK